MRPKDAQGMSATNRVLAILGIAHLLGAACFALLFLGKGRPEANAHPEIRGGGDVGFGGLDFYQEQVVLPTGSVTFAEPPLHARLR